MNTAHKGRPWNGSAPDQRMVGSRYRPPEVEARVPHAAKALRPSVREHVMLFKLKDVRTLNDRPLRIDEIALSLEKEASIVA